jgi:hypothetical protein
MLTASGGCRRLWRVECLDRRRHKDDDEEEEEEGVSRHPVGWLGCGWVKGWLGMGER